MFGILLAVHVLITVLLILVVLVQKSEGGSSLFASGAGNGMFTARGTSDILTKSTWALATIFLTNCILMAHISSKDLREANSIIVNSKLQKSVKNSKMSAQGRKSDKTSRNVSTKSNKTDNKSAKAENKTEDKKEQKK